MWKYSGAICPVNLQSQRDRLSSFSRWLDASAKAIIEIKMSTFIRMWANLICRHARGNKIGFLSAKNTHTHAYTHPFAFPCRRTFSALRKTVTKPMLTHRWFICVFDPTSTRNVYLRSQYPTNCKELVTVNFFRNYKTLLQIWKMEIFPFQIPTNLKTPCKMLLTFFILCQTLRVNNF